MPGTTEVIIICAVIFLIFGAGAIPKFARSIVKARNEFEKGSKESTPESSDSKDSNEKIDSRETR